MSKLKLAKATSLSVQPDTVQALVDPCDCPPELEHKVPLQRTPHSLIVGCRENRLAFGWELPPC